MKSLFSRIACAQLCCAALCFALFAFNNRSNTNRQDQLVVGVVSGYAPFVSINAQGQYEGFDIDVAKELARRMNKQLVINDCGSMVPLMLSLKNGSSDILIWALEINQKRLREMEMIPYQGENKTAYPLIFWNTIPEGVTSMEDLRGKNAVICVEPGSSQEPFLNSFDFITKKTLEKVVDMVMDVKYGKSLAALVDPSLIPTLLQKNPELKVLNVPLSPEFISYGNGICIKKNNTQLIEQVKQTIDAMKADGTLERLEVKWQLKGV